MRKSRRWILLLAIVLSLGAVGYKIVETIVVNKAREIRQNPMRALDHLPESALRIKDFHRSKIENGRKVWELFGEEANYSKEQREAVIKKPKFYFYDKQGEKAETEGEEARLFLTEKELEKMEIQGGIRLSYKGFVLESEQAHYFPSKEQILFPQKVTLVGDGLALEGSTMEVALEDQKIRLEQNVKTKFEPDKLAKRKN